jgi:nicotinic acid mononucleotide adenylyltransferase
MALKSILPSATVEYITYLRIVTMYISQRTVQNLRHIQRQLDQLQPEVPPKALVVSGSPQPREDILVFSGSFNPPTTAHLALLKLAQQFARQHEPMFVYAAFNTHTTDKETVVRPLLLDRILLLKRLLHTRLPHAGILIFNRGLYTEQAEAIRMSFPRVKRIFFLVGFDKIVQILDPRYYDDRDRMLSALFKQATLLVAPRGNAVEQELADLLNQPENKRFARFIHALPFDPAYRAISSTRVRQEGHQATNSVLHNVPQEVRQFIRETRAYAPPVQHSDGSMVDCYEERVKYLSKLIGSPVS